jgi:lysozyme
MAIKRISRKSKNNYFVYKLVFFILLGLFLYSQKNTLSRYLGFISSKTTNLETRNIPLEKILDTHIEKSFGLDISEYQSNIDWDNLEELDGGYPIEFVFIRATAGSKKKDKKFKKYWAKAKDKKLICGAYHYYRPNENSAQQAENFIQTVHLSKGDFPPVLDIERLPKEQSIARLKIGLQRWLTIVEKKYGVKPIIYSNESYYLDFLKDDFAEYPFWIANYTAFYKTINPNWSIWQISENGVVPEINGKVDVNIFNGTSEDLKQLLIQ